MAVDSEVGEPVLLSTRMVEYMVVNRPVLLISPTESPAARLARLSPSTVIRAEPGDAAGIARAMRVLSELAVSPEDYQRRFEATMRNHAGDRVATGLVIELLRRGLV